MKFPFCSRILGALNVVLRQLGLELKRREKKQLSASEIWACLIKYKVALKQLAHEDEKHDAETKVIWSYWAQGESNAPLIVQRCLQSVRRYSGDYRVVVLDQRSCGEYVRVPEWVSCEKTSAHFADYLRVALLERYGGIWLDATVYLTGEMPREITGAYFCIPTSEHWKRVGIPTSERVLFALNDIAYPRNEYMAGTNWMIVARKNCRTIHAMRLLLDAYWQGENRAVTYLFFQWLLSLAIINDAGCASEYRRMPGFDFSRPNILRFSWYGRYDSSWMTELKTMTPIHKLSYKNLKEVPSGSVLERILAGIAL